MKKEFSLNVSALLWLGLSNPLTDQDQKLYDRYKNILHHHLRIFFVADLAAHYYQEQDELGMKMGDDSKTGLSIKLSAQAYDSRYLLNLCKIAEGVIYLYSDRFRVDSYSVTF